MKIPPACVRRIVTTRSDYFDSKCIAIGEVGPTDRTGASSAPRDPRAGFKGVTLRHERTGKGGQKREKREDGLSPLPLISGSATVWQFAYTSSTITVCSRRRCWSVNAHMEVAHLAHFLFTGATQQLHCTAKLSKLTSISCRYNS